MDARPASFPSADTFPAIRDYGAIGNLETVALVANTGAIELFSYPHFDSPTIFAAMLDRSAGAFSVRPTFADVGSQRYVENTNVLVTRFEADGNVVEVTDFMPVGAPSAANQLVRIVTCLDGEAEIVASCDVAFDYGRDESTPHEADGHVVFVDGSSSFPVRLVADRPLTLVGTAAVMAAHLSAGERIVLNLVCDNADTDLLTGGSVDEALRGTIGYWQEWTSQSCYEGPWRAEVMRSALALKLMFSDRHGAMVAAPTFGLPEAIGGERNWDYRYCWVRDSAFTIYAMLRLGFKEEADKYACWVRDRIEERPDGLISLMYRVDGSADRMEEHHLEHLSGYRDSRPVRIGNDAFRQTQIDIYGEVIDTLYLSHNRICPMSERDWGAFSRLADNICQEWNGLGAGFWEMRGEEQRYLDAQLMSWVGLNRAVRLCDRTGRPGADRWRPVMEEVAHSIDTGFWNEEIGAYTQVLGGSTVDATALLIPLMKFKPTTDERFASTLRVIEERLVDGPMVRRYEPIDVSREGVDGPSEGAFVACSFWYIECLARSSRLEEAKALFESICAHASPLGLIAEEVDANGTQLGNMPQALSHLALISAASAIDRAMRNGGEPF